MCNSYIDEGKTHLYLSKNDNQATLLTVMSVSSRRFLIIRPTQYIDDHTMHTSRLVRPLWAFKQTYVYVGFKLHLFF